MRHGLLAAMILGAPAAATSEVVLTLRSAANKTLAEGWRDDFARGAAGCTGSVRDPYVWRDAGYGSNMNYLLVTWLAAILEGRNDVAVIVHTKDFFSRTKCAVASNGVETHGGWPCIFSPVPHLCAFNLGQDWAAYNYRRGLPESEQNVANGRKGIGYVQSYVGPIQETLAASNIDIMDVLAQLFDYLHEHLQPWFKTDAQAILDEPDIATLRGSKYVSMHIRRTDKQIYDGAKFTETEVYFENVARYLGAAPEGLSTTDIAGLWLSSDEEAVLDEVKTLAAKYFPNMRPGGVVYVTGRVPVRPMVWPKFADGATDRNTYEAIVLLWVELQMLAGADVFSGTFSSNLGRVVALMRHTLGKARNSALSADDPEWFPARR